MSVDQKQVTLEVAAARASLEATARAAIEKKLAKAKLEVEIELEAQRDRRRCLIMDRILRHFDLYPGPVASSVITKKLKKQYKTEEVLEVIHMLHVEGILDEVLPEEKRRGPKVIRYEFHVD